jgi:hypothetical protein
VTAVHPRSSTEAAFKAAAGGCAFDFDVDSFARAAGAIGRGRFGPVDVGA